jgi:peptidoglycan/LPS O-acetylase OafA/YrhL
MGKGNSRHKNVEIEALRGVAILFVLFAHMGAYLFPDDLYRSLRRWVQPGTGVDLFFCISGYVIARQYLGEASTGRSRFWANAVPFWIRRFWRLAPSAWLWIFLGMGLLWVSEVPTADYVHYATAAIFQVANVYQYHCVYGTGCGPNTVYWSLSLEEQFYLLFPFVVAVVPRRFALIFFVGLFLVQAFTVREFPQLLWFVRTDAIALGVVIALLAPRLLHVEPTFLQSRLARFTWFGGCLITLLIATAPGVHFIKYQIGLVAVVSAMLVWAASYEKGYIASVGPLRSVLAFLGARSYAMYLIHYPAAWITGLIIGQSIVVFPILLGLAELNYRIVEKPLRAYGARVAARFKDRPSGADAMASATTP